MWDINTFEYLLFDNIIMSAIDTYKKCNLHSAAPYIRRDVRVCKKAGGNVQEGETSWRRCPGEMSYTP